MFEKMSLKNRLFMGAAILAAALVAEAGVGLQVAKNMSENLQNVYDSSRPLNNLKKVSDAYAVGITGAVMYTRSGQGWEIGRDMLETAIKAAQENWEAYLGSKNISEEEKIPVAVVTATLNNNKYFLVQLREAFEKRDSRSLEILATSNLTAVVNPIVESMNKLVDLKWKKSELIVGKALADYQKAFLFMVILAGTSLFLGLGMSLLLALAISRKFQSIATQLVGSAAQVGSVSEKIARAGSQQAKGAADSTASLLQTSVALSEMASMTEKNAQGAIQANRIMERTQESMVGSNKSMEDTLSAMRSVNESAGKIHRIAKSIEEIAQQTNILSLNASVEAARAGEHGKGFAVVAEEVRGLAQRSAQAAKETSQLIEENARQVSHGMEVAKSAGEALKEMAAHTRQAAGLLAEIQDNSQEQSKGIKEIGTMMDKLEGVTQNNNVNAKENVMASEDMARQASGLKGVVKQLVTIVEGSAVQEKSAGLEMVGSSVGNMEGLGKVSLPVRSVAPRTSWAGWFGKKKNPVVSKTKALGSAPPLAKAGTN